MKGSLKKLILLVFYIGVISCVHAQVRFTASISPQQINKNEYAVLRLEIQNGENIEKIAPPALKGFSIISGPNQETGMSSVNGVTRQYVAISYILQPETTGAITLEPSTAKISGKVFKSNKLKLMVKNRVSDPRMSPNVASTQPFAGNDPFVAPRSTEEFDDFILKKGENVPQKVHKSMQLKLQTNKTTCYVGEPIVATYKLYTRLKSESKLSKTPSFNGFSVIDLQRPDETEYGREKLNGREYNVYTIRKAQLYPLQDGAIELESATLDNRIQFLRADATGSAQQSMSGFLEGFAMSPGDVVTESVSLSNKPLTVTVKPLPEEGKPAGFKGAVGRFEVSSKLESNSFSTNEAGKLTVTISGSGNLQLVTPPDITWPGGVEAFEPKQTEDLQPLSVPVSGTKTIEFPFTVSKAGEYILPQIDFSYFDPSIARYKTIQLPPQRFTVTRGVPKPTLASAAPVISAQSDGFAKQLFDNRGWIVAGVGLLILSGLLIWLKKDHDQHKKWKASLTEVPPVIEEVVAPVLAEKIPFNLQNPLSKAEDCLLNTDCSQFYSLLYTELKDYLAYKFNLHKEQVNIKNIASALDKRGVENEVVLELQELLQEIEWQLYTPFERNEEMGLFYSRSHSLLQSIERNEPATL